MNYSDFLKSVKGFLESSPSLALEDHTRCIFISDLHMGDGGSRDDLEHNRGLATTVLARWYLERGYGLILGGDVEDAAKFKLGDVRKAWPEMYEIFDAFAAKGALWKLVGNHDYALLAERERPYPLHGGIRLERKGRSLFCFHGHQASNLFVEHMRVGDAVVRYLAKPLRIKNASISGDSRLRFKAERRIYRASKALGIASICGHTHRPLFESLSKYDSLRWAIEIQGGAVSLVQMERGRQGAPLPPRGVPRAGRHRGNRLSSLHPQVSRTRLRLRPHRPARRPRFSLTPRLPSINLLA